MPAERKNSAGTVTSSPRVVRTTARPNAYAHTANDAAKSARLTAIQPTGLPSKYASSPGAAFSFLSGSGADPTGRSRMAFARYKGEAEKALLAAGFPQIYIFRPAYIYPVKP